MRSYGYDTSLIAEFLENSFERYSAVLLDNYKVIIKTVCTLKIYRENIYSFSCYYFKLTLAFFNIISPIAVIGNKLR